MAKKDKLSPSGGQNPPDLQKDDALFETLGKNKKRKRRRILLTVLSVTLVLAIIVAATVSVLQKRVRQRFNASSGKVLTYEVTTGTISTVVSGSGTLQNVDTQGVSVPSGVDVTEILVEYGDSVTEGSLLATVDPATVRSAMSDIQTQIEALDKQIRAAEGDKVSTCIKAGVSGRVKILYAQKGMSVSDVMVEQGALAVISLDGCMALDLQTDALSAGDRVSVIHADGSEIEGTAEWAAGGKATILVTDNGPENGETVTVKAEDGTVIGTAQLYIHNPLSVTGYAGTVNSVNVSENQKVSSSTTLFTLTDTSTSASYDALLRQRSEAEETLLELLKLQRYGGVAAPISGSISSVGDADDETLTELAVISPDVSMSVTINVDESDILSLALDQTAEVTVSSVSEETLTGTVTEIDKTGASGAYTAVITLAKQTGMLPGMTAEVDVRIEGVDNALIIPVEALHKTSTEAYVYTSYDAELQEYGGKTTVVVGLSNSNYVEIKSGLQPGDKVYYTKTQTLAEIFSSMGYGGSSGGSGNSSGSGGTWGGSGSTSGGSRKPNAGGQG